MPDWTAFDHIEWITVNGVKRRAGMSPTEAGAWHGCAFAAHQRYVLGVKTPPTRLMLMGRLFDDMCNIEWEGDAAEGAFDLPELSMDDIKLVEARYFAYRSHINYEHDKLQVPLYCRIPGTQQWAYGIADRVCYTEDSPSLLVDHKFSETFKPMTPAAKEIAPNVWRGSLKNMPDSWAWQAKSYVYMGEGMWLSVVPFEFHVVNAEDERIQIVPCPNTGKHKTFSIGALSKVPPHYCEAWAKMVAGEREPLEDREELAKRNYTKCYWCGHKEQCDEFYLY